MTDLLTQASEIAELRDLDLFQPFLDELTRWRPEHEGLCPHCQASIVAHSQRLLDTYQLSPRWVANMLQTLLDRTADD